MSTNAYPASAGDEPHGTVVPRPVDPKKNPAYPQRVHLQERPHWQGVLRSWEERIAVVRQKIQVLGTNADRARYDRLYFQMVGARDQIADAARRLPMETGDLYEEDKHRLEEAVAALERLFARWDAQSGAGVG